MFTSSAVLTNFFFSRAHRWVPNVHSSNKMATVGWGGRRVLKSLLWNDNIFSYSGVISMKQSWLVFIPVNLGLNHVLHNTLRLRVRMKSECFWYKIIIIKKTTYLLIITSKNLWQIACFFNVFNFVSLIFTLARYVCYINGNKQQQQNKRENELWCLAVVVSECRKNTIRHSTDTTRHIAFHWKENPSVKI